MIEKYIILSLLYLEYFVQKFFCGIYFTYIKLDQCNFKDRYTLYSLRSTHITFALLRKIPIKTIADNCGTSQAEIERTYQRINNILNIKDLGFFQDSTLTSDDELIIEPLLKSESE